MKEIKIEKGTLLIIASVVCFLTIGFLWTVQFYGDTYDTYRNVRELKFSALHFITNCIIFFVGMACCICAFSIWDEDYCGNKYFGIKPFKIFLIVLLVLFLIWGHSIFKGVTKMYNTNVSYVHQYNILAEERVGFYDKMYRTYIQKYDICELNKETFIEVTKIIMDGRNDGENVSWKFVHENQNIDHSDFSRFYADLSNFVASQREAYFDLEKQCYDIVRKNNELLDTFPNNIYSGWVNCERIEPHQMGFTSEQTRNVFNSGIEK